MKSLPLSIASLGGAQQRFVTHGHVGLPETFFVEAKERVLQRALLLRQRTALTNAIKAIQRRLGRRSPLAGLAAHVPEEGDQLGAAPHNHIVAPLRSRGRAPAVSGDNHTQGVPLSVFSTSTKSLRLARQELMVPIKEHEIRLRYLAESVYQVKPGVQRWVETTRGVGPLGLMLLLGHAGDISLYANPAKLWKRFGVGLVQREGRWVAQRRVARNAEAAEVMGFCPARRAVLHTLGDALVKLNKGVYRAIYDSRKVLEREKLGGPHASKLHVHKRAMRVMEKRLLKDLWLVWRGTPDLAVAPSEWVETTRRLEPICELFLP